MDHGEQHLVALGLQFEGYVATALPGDGEFSGWIDLGDPALHPVLVAETGRPLSGRVGKLVVAPDELERGTGLQLHLPRGQPLPPRMALVEVGRHPRVRDR